MFDVIIHSVVKLPPVKTQPALKYTQQWRISWDQCLFLDWVSKETTNDKHKQNRYCGKLILHLYCFQTEGYSGPVFPIQATTISVFNFNFTVSKVTYETWILLWILHKLNKKNTSTKRMMSASFGGERSVPEKKYIVKWCRAGWGLIGFRVISGEASKHFYQFGWCHLISRFIIHPKTKTGWKWDYLLIFHPVFFAVPVVFCVPAWNLRTHSILAKWNNISGT